MYGEELLMNLIEVIDSYTDNKEEIAHKYGTSSKIYKELSEKSDAIATYLIKKFGTEKTSIIVYGHKQHEMLICFLECVKVGHSYVPAQRICIYGLSAIFI